jgi:putative DNA primase/helicase
LIGGGFKNATTDPRKIHMWWSRWPEARIGLPTGEKFFVVDVDRLTALGELPAELPATWTVRTPRAGLHFYFAAVEGITNSPGNLPAGIDVRGTGGYVIGPPSPGYNVIDRTPLASAPDWLLKIIRGPRKPDPQPPRRSDADQTTLDLDGPPILEGSRHTTLSSVAGRLHDGTRDAGQLIADLLAVNDARCTPPLEVEEVAAIATWTASKEPCSSGRPPELTAMLARLSESWWRLERRGLGGKNEVRFARVLLEEGNRIGTVVEDGLRVSMSVRQAAEKLSCSVNTVRAVRDRLAEKELLRYDRSEAGKKNGSGAFVLLARRTLHTPTDPPAIERVGGGGSPSSRTQAAALETAHFRHRGPVGYSREDTLCYVESHPGGTREDLAALMGWSRARDLERLHLRPLAELGLIEEREGRWTISHGYAEAQQDVKLIAFSTIQLRSARQWDPEAGRWAHFVTESGSVASQEKREEQDIERHRQQRILFRLRLAELRENAEESCQTGPVVVEHGGYLVDVETGEVRGYAVRSGWNADEIPDELVAS